MGGNISVSLDLDEDSLQSKTLFRGTLVLLNKRKRPLKLQRAARVSMQFRNTMYINAGELTIENVQVVWQVGGDLAKSGTLLIPGENRFDFEYSLQGKANIEMEPLEDWAKKFGGIQKMKYDYIIRAGSPPQTKDVILYPRLFPPGETGERMGRHVVSPESTFLAAAPLVEIFFSF